MGCKAEGAAQGYTILGGIVLGILAIQMLSGGLNGAMGGDINSLIDVVLAIALIIMVILAFDACGFINWKFTRSGLLLAIVGFISMIIAARSLPLDIIGWLTNIYLLSGFMILLGGLLIMINK